MLNFLRNKRLPNTLIEQWQVIRCDFSTTAIQDTVDTEAEAIELMIKLALTSPTNPFSNSKFSHRRVISRKG